MSYSQEYRDKISTAMKTAWRDPVKRQRIMDGIHKQAGSASRHDVRESMKSERIAIARRDIAAYPGDSTFARSKRVHEEMGYQSWRSAYRVFVELRMTDGS